MKKLLNDQSGMTLIDVAMVLMVLGLLLAPALATYKEWKVENERGTTRKNMLAINKALADYYFSHDYTYPCPADPEGNPSQDDYGVADCSATEIASGDAYVGALPFTDLLLPSDITLDGFSNKFTYAVSADPEAPVLEIPNIDCETGAPAPSANAHFVIISHGETGVGARTAFGVERQACVEGSNMEAENCDGDITFVQETCTSNVPDENFYDDLTFHTATAPTRIWTESPEDHNDIMTDVAKVGINNLNPQFNLDVTGNIKATKTLANEICDPGNPANPAAAANCFNPSLIGGDEPEMDCSSNTDGATIMTGIGGSKAKCNISHTLPTTDCAANGRYIVGIGANGEVICGS